MIGGQTELLHTKKADERSTPTYERNPVGGLIPPTIDRAIKQWRPLKGGSSTVIQPLAGLGQKQE